MPKVVQIGRALGSGRAVFMDGSRWILSEADLRLAAVTRISGTSGHAMLEAVPGSDGDAAARRGPDQRFQYAGRRHRQ